MSPQEPSAQEIYAKPWHYIGYPGLDKWLASDNNFLILRRYDALAARVLLWRQWQLGKLEAELSALDIERNRGADEDIHNGSFEQDDELRQLCICKVDEHLKQYYEFMNSYIAVRQKPNASSQAKRDVQKWIASWNNNAIDEKETAYIGNADLFALVETPRAPLRQLFEKAVDFSQRLGFQAGASNLAAGRQMEPKPGTPRHRVRAKFFEDCLTGIIGFLMLVAPMWILIYVPSRQHQLAVITVFVFVFLALVQCVTLARPFETLAATAAYVNFVSGSFLC